MQQPYTYFVKNRFAINLLCGLINTLLILAVFAKISGNEVFMDVFFNSDTLYLPSIYNDLFRDGGAISDWELNPAPNFFPDMLVYFLLMAAFKNFVLVSMLYSILQYLVVVWLFTLIFRLVFPTHSINYNLVINFLLSFFLLETLFFTESFHYSFVVLSNAYHMGSFILALSCFYLTLRYLFKPRGWQLVLLFLLQVLGALSDKLFIISFTLPLVACVMLLSESIGWVRARKFIAISVTALIVSELVFIGLVESKAMSICTPPLLKETNTIRPSLITFIELMTYYAGIFGFKQFILVLFVVSLALNVFLCLQQRSKPFSGFKFYQYFVLFFSVFVLVAPILSGNFLTGDQIRYNLYPFCLFPLNMSVFIAQLKSANQLKSFGKYVVITFTLTLLGIGVAKLNFERLNDFKNYYPDTARQMDSIASTQKLGYGIASYWYAKKTTMFSKKGLVIYHVDGAISVYPHVANKSWYYSPRTFDFILLEGLNDTTFVTQKLKPLNFICYKKNFRLLRVSPFMFRQEQGLSPVNLGYKN